jgi:site-specific DNA recombinase
MKRAVLYARVSGDDRGKEGRNLASQLEMCHTYAQQKGYIIKAELAEDDRGASGAEIDLPQLSRVRKMARAGEFDVLVVRELDRLSRNLAKQLIVEQELKRAGVTIEYVLGEYPDTPEGNLMKHVRATIAEFEREKIVERSIRGRRNMVSQGKIMLHGNKPPYGYRTSEDGTTLVVHEPEARIVRLVFQWYTEGDEAGKRLSSVKIACRLSEMQVPTWTDLHPGSGGYKKRPYGEWSPASILAMLHREAYKGKWNYGKHRPSGTNNKEHWVSMEVPALVSVETWEQAQKQCKASKIMAPRHVKHEYLLRYLLSCKHCGRAVGALTCTCGGKEYSYYMCYGRANHNVSPGEKCLLPYFRADHVDAVVWEWVKSFLTDPEALIQGLEEQQAKREESCHPARERLAAIEELLTDNQEQMQRLLDLYLMGDFAKEMLVEHKTRLEAIKEALQAEKDNLTTRIESQTITGKQLVSITEFAEKIASGLDKADRSFEARRQIIELLDTKGSLALENEEKVIYVQCVIGDEALAIAPTSSNTARI